MQGGVALFLLVVILVAAVLSGLYLTGAGGYLRHKQMEGELGDDRRDDDGRPEHLEVENEAKADSAVSHRPAGRWAGSEGDADSTPPSGTAGRDAGGDRDADSTAPSGSAARGPRGARDAGSPATRSRHRS